MSPRGKKKTSFAKLNREARLRDRREEKRVRKEARREAAASPAARELPAAVHHDGASEEEVDAG